MDGWVLWSLRSCQYLQTSCSSDRCCLWMYGTTPGVNRDNFRLRPCLSVELELQSQIIGASSFGFPRRPAVISAAAASFPCPPPSRPLSSVPSVKSVVARLGASLVLGIWLLGIRAKRTYFAKRTQFRSMNTGLSQKYEPIWMMFPDLQPPSHPAFSSSRPAQHHRIKRLREF
jgi:hypothetical protein